MVKSMLFTAALLVSVSSFAVKPDDAGSKGAEQKAAAEEARLCRQAVIDQKKALDKKSGGQSNGEQLKTLQEELKACNPHSK